MRNLVFASLAIILLAGCALRTTEPAAGPARPSGTIIALGTSLTAGPGVGENETYPAYLERMLKDDGYGFTVENRGINGATSDRLLQELPEVIRQSPDIVILEAGANDAVRLYDPNTTQQNIEKMVRQLQEAGISVILAGSPRVSIPYWDYPERFTRIYGIVAESRNVTMVPHFLDGVIGVQAFNRDDRVHPNAQGYERIAQNVYPYVTGEIARRTGTITTS